VLDAGAYEDHIAAAVRKAPAICIVTQGNGPTIVAPIVMSSEPEGGQTERAFPVVRSQAGASPPAEATAASSAQPAADESGSSAGTLYFVTALIAAAMGGVTGYLLKPPPILETSYVNFDAESTPRAILGDGWSPFFQHIAAGLTFCWCSAMRCTLNVSSAAKQDRLIRARLTPFTHEGAPQQIVTAYLNGSKIGSGPVAPNAFTTLSVSASRQYWLPGINALSFEFTYAKDPKSVLPGADDTRVYSAAFDWVEITAK
jgi:hypothetical protein